MKSPEPKICWHLHEKGVEAEALMTPPFLLPAITEALGTYICQKRSCCFSEKKNIF